MLIVINLLIKFIVGISCIDGIFILILDDIPIEKCIEYRNWYINAKFLLLIHYSEFCLLKSDFENAKKVLLIFIFRYLII